MFFRKGNVEENEPASLLVWDLCSCHRFSTKKNFWKTNPIKVVTTSLQQVCNATPTLGFAPGLEIKLRVATIGDTLVSFMTVSHFFF